MTAAAAPLDWAVIRELLAEAVAEALGGSEWLSTRYIPSTPDDPASWIDWPTMERASLQGHFRYVTAAVFAVGLGDVEKAQAMIDDLYAGSFHQAITAAAADRDLKVTMNPPDRPTQVDLPNGQQMLVFELPLELVA